MKEPRWVSLELAIRAHSRQLALFGGPAGLRDRGLLESALDRAPNKWAYGERDIAILAAAYAFGIARNHPFVDGNKRTAFLVSAVFLARNGRNMTAPPSSATQTFLALAAGELDEPALAGWIKSHLP